jgi:hypothetical protein
MSTKLLGGKKIKKGKRKGEVQFGDTTHGLSGISSITGISTKTLGGDENKKRLTKGGLNERLGIKQSDLDKVPRANAYITKKIINNVAPKEIEKRIAQVDEIVGNLLKNANKATTKEGVSLFTNFAAGVYSHIPMDARGDVIATRENIGGEQTNTGTL